MRQFAPAPEARHLVSLSQFVFSSTSFCLILILCAASVSCGGSGCIIGVFNPGGTVTVSNNPCSVTISNGAMAIRVGAAPAPENAPAATDLQHIFVSIQGIEMQPAASSEDESVEWKELAPELREHPVQADLLAPARNMCRIAPLTHAAVPAGIYRKLRISLVPDPPPDGTAVPATNRCGAVGLHCAISSRGDIRSLIWNGVLESLPPEPSGGEPAIRVLPDVETDLTLLFHPYAAAAPSTGESLRLTPIFTASATLPCD